MEGTGLFYAKTRRQLSIYFGHNLHLRIPFRNVIAIHSWIDVITGDTNYPLGRKYCIEYHFRAGTSIMTEYASEATWKDILRA